MTFLPEHKQHSKGGRYTGGWVKYQIIYVMQFMPFVGVKAAKMSTGKQERAY